MCLTAVRVFAEQGVPAGHVALDTLENQSDLERELEELMGGKVDILGGYFGVHLPAVFVNGKQIKRDGQSLHFWLQEAIEPPFEMDETKGIVGCVGLEERLKLLTEEVKAQLGEDVVARGSPS